MKEREDKLKVINSLFAGFIKSNFWTDIEYKTDDFTEKNGTIKLKILNETIIVNCPLREVRADKTELNADEKIMTLRYLASKPLVLTQRYVDFKDIAGNAKKYEIFREKTCHPLVEKFRKAPFLFFDSAVSLGAEVVPQGDAGARFRPFKGITVTYVFWHKNAENPRMNVLYDSSIRECMDADSVFALTDFISKKMITYKK